MTALTRTPASGPAAALLAAAELDRDGLADRLHDGALQALVVARYACDAVARGADPALARDAVQDALVTLRREVWMLRPRGDEGLMTALLDLCAQLVAAGRPGLRLHADPALGEAAADVSGAAVAAAYRLVQAVAGDTLLAVRLTADGDRLALTLDAPVPDPETWALRARAVGAELIAGPTSTLLLLPTSEDLL